jgi:hypothetical protein
VRLLTLSFSSFYIVATTKLILSLSPEKMMNRTKSETDRDRVLAFKEKDAIPYQPEDGPYDPNDAEATRVIRSVRSDSQGQGGTERQARPAKGADKEAGFVAFVAGSG